MIGRTHIALIALLILVLLVALSVKLETNLLELRAFELQSTIFHVIASSFALGALILFILLTLLPQKTAAPKSTVPDSSIPQISLADALLEANALLEMGANDRAEAILDRHVSEGRDMWFVYKLRGDLHFNRGNGSRAEECYRKGLQAAAGSQRALLHRALGSLFEFQDRPEDAMEMYASALRIDPALPDPLFRLRQISVEQQDWEKALFWQERIESNLPGNRESEAGGWNLGIRLELAWEQYGSGSWKAAQALVKYVLRMSQSFPSAFLLAGEIQERLGHSVAAIKTWERGLETTHHPVLMRRISDSHLMRNEPLKAISSYQQPERAGVDSYFAEYCLGELYLRLEMIEEARKTFENISRKEPGWVLNEMSLGETLHKMGESARAAEIFQEMVRSMDSTSVQLWQCYHCGTTYPEYHGYCVECLEWNTINVNRNKAGRVEMTDAKSSAWSS